MNPDLLRRWSAVAALASSLAACGGGGGNADTLPPPTPAPAPPPGTARGTLMGTGNTSTITASAINNFGADGTKGPFPAGEHATCTVTIRQIRYATIDVDGALITASAGLQVPGGGAGCSSARPLVSFQHGTSDTSSFSASDPTAIQALTMAKYFVSHGYAVVTPDYLGYGVTAGHFHPYVQAEPNAVTIIDAIRAARQWFASADGVASGTTLNGQLFLTGTSEGGYMTMATHRAIERDVPTELAITADVPISGPYDLSTEVLNDLEQSDAQHNSATGSSAFLLTAYQDTYHDLWSQPSQVFQTPWDTRALNLFPGSFGSDSEAIQACRLPKALDTAPSPPVSGCDGPTDQNPLLQPTFVTDYENSQPGTPGGITRAHVQANDLLQGWAGNGRNQAPMVLCYGDLDPVAALNAQSAARYFSVPAVDVQTTGPAFITAWMQSATNSGLNYHGEVEAPGCTAYARYSVFDTYVSNVP